MSASETPPELKYQLILDILSEAQPVLGRLLGERNRELLSVLQQQQERFVYVWGQAGAGQSRVLQAWAAQQPKHSLYVDAKTEPLPKNTQAIRFLAIDNVSALKSSDQIRLFTAFNRRQRVQEDFLLCADTVPPPQLMVRDDLRTRMGLCLIYAIKPLSDEEKISVLQTLATARQMNVEPEIFSYLLTHYSRDIEALMTFLGELDRHSLAHTRRITLPFLKQYMQREP